ncbi:L-fucose:H+ symporter permease [Granulicella sp. L46]|uniref:L-fucose:H+ symporter permease n=1 Tax=Granulicella sp. L46 TaxID=1641865 RepID=UPI00131C3174|nr:L-fucose:H+ symporter permease [Granulicella sp. L46]
MGPNSPSREHGLAESFPLFSPGALLPCMIVTALFFLWGIPNNLNDILIRQFMKSFAITRMQGGLVQSAFYMGYFLLALPSALYMRRFGYKAGFVTGLCLFGAGTFLFWPAALIERYWCFLIALFVMASGLAFLETASNTFIAMSGPAETSERRLNFSQAFNPLGSITGSFIGTVFILSGIELSPQRLSSLQASGQYDAYLHFETLRVVQPYLILGVVAIGFACLLLATRFPKLRDDGPAEHPSVPILRLLKNRNLLFSIITQFFYVGAQVGTWSYFIQYIQDYAHQPEKTAGYFLTGTLCMFGIGRFTSAYLMKFISPPRLMAAYSFVNFILVAVAVFHPGWIGVWTIFLTSFFMSLMYPTVFALGLQGLGTNSKVGGSLIVMAIVGGAVLTPLMGVIADASKHLAVAYCVPLFGYVVIAAYSLFVSAQSEI